MPIIEVLNSHTDDCRGARSMMRGTPWGNPFIIGVDGDRQHVLRLFRRYAEWRLQIQPKWLEPLRHVRKVKCACKPYPCHGDIIAE